MANAHAHRHRIGKGRPCSTPCLYCDGNNMQRKAANKPRLRNKNGHRHNPGK